MDLIGIWLPALPTFLLTLAALFIPGTIVGVAAGLRGKTLCLANVPISIFLVSFTPIVMAAIGIPWGWFSLSLATFFLSLVMFLLARFIPGFGKAVDNKKMPRTLFIQILIGTLFAAFVSFWGATRAMGSPVRPPQTWDAAFHLSAVRLIINSGNGSTFFVGTLSEPGSSFAFYPAGWHDLVSLTVPLTGDPVIASNMTSLAVITILCPLGAALFASVLFPRTPYVALASALIAGTLTAFPERLASYGTLWPVLLGYSIIPFLLGLAVIILQNSRLTIPPRLIFVLILGLLGVTVVHPQSVLALLTLVAFLLLSTAWKVITKRQEATLSAKIFLVLIILGALSGPLLIGLTSYGQSTSGWTGREPTGTIWREIWGVLSDSQLSDQGYGNVDPKYLLVILFFIGIYYLIRERKQLWLIPAWIFSVYLYLVVTTMSLPGYALGGLWYYDPVRLGAISPLAYAPIAAFGAAKLTMLLLTMLGKFFAWPSSHSQMVGAIVVIVVISGGTGLLGKDTGSHQISSTYWYSGAEGPSGLVSDEELGMLHRLADELPEDAIVIGDPFTGASLVYALSDREVLYKHLSDRSDEVGSYLRLNFDQIQTDPQVCNLLNENGIEYFYSDSIIYSLGNIDEHLVYKGLRDFRWEEGDLELVDQGGTASVYRLALCD